MKVYIGNDHGGYHMKMEIAEYLRKHGHEVTDVGSGSTDIVRYPYYAAEVARAVQSGKADRGILICSTGIGMSIIANKFKKVRAAVCTDTYCARMTRAHNNSNVLCLGGKVTGSALAQDMVETWMTTEYEGGRHDISLGLIEEAEDAMIGGAPWKETGKRK